MQGRGEDKGSRTLAHGRKVTPDAGTDEMVISQFSGDLQLRHGCTPRVLKGVLQLLGIDGILELNSVGDDECSVAA